jgi:hypothetical protein
VLVHVHVLGQPPQGTADTSILLGYEKLDVYRCAFEHLAFVFKAIPRDQGHRAIRRSRDQAIARSGDRAIRPSPHRRIGPSRARAERAERAERAWRPVADYGVYGRSWCQSLEGDPVAFAGRAHRARFASFTGGRPDGFGIGTC